MLDALLHIAASSWDVLLESAPFMLFGFLVAGLIKALVPDDFVSRHLGGGTTHRSISAVFKAALLGVPLPLCSCGVVPAAAGIRRQGASRGATTSFLISTPETGVDSIAVTYALLDPLMTVVRPVAAFLSAIVAGVAVDLTHADDAKTEHEPGAAATASFGDTGEQLQDVTPCGSGCGCGSGGCSISTGATQNQPWPVRVRQGLAYAFGDLLVDIGGWFLIGILIAGAVAALVPADLVTRYLGSGIVPMLAMLALSLPVYVCATSSTPVAAALVLKGLSPGAALVFLLAGPATNAATILVVARMLGKRAATAYVAVVAVVAVGMGFVVDALYVATGMNAAQWAGAADADVAGPLALPSAIVLLVLILWPRIRTRLHGGHGHEHGHGS